ncbi:Uu.00g051410.m01.CDS01 [Anthostomella pinea]|uniref:Uu.00g051410.m01.CDS01 n=1 Tax=Anthostomella pinea TaxID=933095 RepID=A0AAI8VTM6_9PEZI|nr:Uu.00g051410.m01.CDS01 [Anthostomella pinea]
MGDKVCLYDGCSTTSKAKGAAMMMGIAICHIAKKNDDRDDFSRVVRQDKARDADADATGGGYARSGPPFDAEASPALPFQPAPEPQRQDPGPLSGDNNIDSFDDSLPNGKDNNTSSSIPPVWPAPPPNQTSRPI